MRTFFYLFTITLTLSACTFDPSGPPAGDPADDLACETDRDCQAGGLGCNVYSCEEGTCAVADVLCDDGEVCAEDGCVEAPPATCENHVDCAPDPGCEAAYCAEDGTCVSYGCGASLCDVDTDCAEDEECTADGRCIAVVPVECVEVADCPAHDWSCMVSECDGSMCGFADTCPTDKHCTAEGCVSDVVPTALTIDCQNVDGTQVTFTGDIGAGIVVTDGDLPGTPGKVSIAGNVGIGSGAYWPGIDSGIDSTHPACDVDIGANGAWSCASALGMGDSVQEFQFVVANVANTNLRYFDLSKWEVTGYCAKDSSGGLLCSCESLPCVCP